MKSFRLNLTVLLAIFILGWSSTSSRAASHINLGPAAPIDLEVVATGLERITAITHAGDGSGRLFINLQRGKLVIFDGTQVLSTPFLDITNLVYPIGGIGDERGFLSVAFHPNYVENGYFYVNYTNRNSSADTVIARYRVSRDNPNVADPNSGVILLTIRQPGFSNHKGGQLQFGPDGYLYIGTGDGGSGGDPGNRAQNLGEMLGKMLRIDVDSDAPYAIPPDNPFLGTQGARPEIWAYGLRNPWRFSFDRATGDLFIADVGQNLYEEIDYQPASSAGGENYGWRRMEGFHCFNPPTDCNDGSLTLPILEYDHGSLGGCSVTGGYRYRGNPDSPLYGVYLYGDYCTGRIWGATSNPSGEWSTTELLRRPINISTFGEGENGEIYVAHFATSSTLYRIVSTP